MESSYPGNATERNFRQVKVDIMMSCLLEYIHVHALWYRILAEFENVKKTLKIYSQFAGRPVPAKTSSDAPFGALKAVLAQAVIWREKDLKGQKPQVSVTR